MSDSPSDEEKKIIIDEDWKSQVERERKEMRSAPDSPEDAQPSADDSTQLPPASFLLLATTLATQAMAGLGQIPDPLEKKPIVNLELARHYIDLLGVLEEKTQGNLTEEEKEMLTSVLYQLRSVYIAIERELQSPQDS